MVCVCIYMIEVVFLLVEGSLGWVVFFYNEYDFVCSLVFWVDFGWCQQQVKVWLVFIDLSVFVLCFVVGCLLVWFCDDVSFLQVMNIWWVINGYLCFMLFVVIVLIMVSWMWIVQGYYIVYW